MNKKLSTADIAEQEEAEAFGMDVPTYREFKACERIALTGTDKPIQYKKKVIDPDSLRSDVSAVL